MKYSWIEFLVCDSEINSGLTYRGNVANKSELFDSFSLSFYMCIM